MGAWGDVIPRDFPCHLEIGSLLALLPGYQEMFPFDFKRGAGMETLVGGSGAGGGDPRAPG